MWYLEAEKERKLSNTLQRWHDAAKLKKAQYSTQLDTLQQQAADMAEDMAGDAPLQESGAHQGLHVPLVSHLGHLVESCIICRVCSICILD